MNAGGNRPKDVAKSEFKKVCALGAGIEVVLKDIRLETAEKGKG